MRIASLIHSRSGTAHAPSPDVRCGPPGLSLTRKSAALRHPWLRWPPTPALGARAAPPRTSIRKDDGGRMMEEGWRRKGGGGGGIGERLRSAGPPRPKRRNFCRPAADAPRKSRCATEVVAAPGPGLPIHQRNRLRSRPSRRRRPPRSRRSRQSAPRSVRR